MEVRPVYHSTEQGIRAHVLLCFLALVLVRVAERANPGHTWPTLRRELDRIHLVELAGSSGHATQSSEITGQQQAVYTNAQITPPPLVHTFEPTSGAA